MWVVGNIEWRSLKHCRRGKVLSITYSEFVCDTVIRHAKHTCRITLSYVACLTTANFSMLSQTKRISGGKDIYK